MSTGEPRRGKRRPGPIDLAVARRIASLCRAARINQAELGRRIGVTQQQISEYFKGNDRMNAQAIFLTTKVLGITPNLLFEALDEEMTAAGFAAAAQSPYEGPAESEEQAKRLSEAYSSVTDPEARRSVLAFAEMHLDHARRSRISSDE